MENRKVIPLEDEALEAAAGGAGSNTSWPVYAQTTVLPILRYGSRRAEGNDLTLVNQYWRALNDTTMPGGPDARKEVRKLWNSFDASAFQSEFARNQVYGALLAAYCFFGYQP